MQGKTGKSRSGVALVVVLGLVAILLIVSVAFTIHMRVERAGAANLRHAAVARQVVKGALAAAIAAIDDEVLDDFAPSWYDDKNPGAPLYSRSMYVATENKVVTKNFWKDTFISYDTNAVEHIAASFFTPEVERYFPSGSAYKGYALKFGASGYQTAIQQPEWIPFRDDDGGVMGRYAFFIMDTSGLLDASCVNRADRWMGKDTGEIRLSTKILPEVVDADGLSDNMVSDGRYESFAEFRALNEEKESVIKDTRSFSTFSYEPTNGFVYIGGSADDIRGNKQQIIRAFYDCGLTAGKSFGTKDSEQARWAYLGLVDFVDDGDDMEDDSALGIKPYERPVTENMPVMSGFIAKFTVEAHERVVEDGNNKVGDTDEQAYKLDSTCSMTMSVVFKVPFVYPFLKQTPAQSASLKFNAKATIYAATLPASAKGANADTALRNLIDSFADEIGTGAENWGGQDDNAVEIKPEIFTATSDNIKLVDVGGGKKVPSKLKGMEMLFRAAGGTWLGGDCQHRYPIKEADYNNHYTWMTSSFDGFGADDNAKMHDFIDDPDAGGKYCVEKDALKEDGTPKRDKNGNKIKYKTWTPEPVVTWAEFVDPRFASVEMADIDDAGQLVEDQIAEDQFVYYRPGHLSSGHATQFQFDYPVTELKGKFAEFNAFTAADTVTAADFDGDMHGGYFNGDSNWNGTGCPGGARPLTSYFLTHPSAVNKLYKIRMDGIRNDPDATKNDTDSSFQQWRAYVKNAPLESVGELGYLPIGMWHTIRIYDYDDDKVSFGTGTLPKRMAQFNHLPVDDDENAPPFHPVLDHFTLDKDRQSMPQGRVNINTLNTNVLATVFHYMPVGTEEGSKLYLAPGERSTYGKYRIDADASGNETDDSLGLVARAVMEYRKKSAAGVFENLSELGRIFKYGGVALNGADKGYVAKAVSNAARGDGRMGEFERESVVRNSCGLFTTRGQTFIIVVRGEAYSPMFGKTSVEGGSVNAAKTAIAQIWRDSEPDKNGNHPVFVQFFKIIDD